MQTLDEIPLEPYAEIVRMLLAAGAAVPERLGPDGPLGATLVAELGIDLP
jgi:aminoglycoside/choline kinase family phosphotransferase